jgi:hypothetical protein
LDNVEKVLGEAFVSWVRECVVYGFTVTEQMQAGDRVAVMQSHAALGQSLGSNQNCLAEESLSTFVVSCSAD